MSRQIDRNFMQRTRGRFELTSNEQKTDHSRDLCNLRPPIPTTAAFLTLPNEYLTKLKNKRGIVNVNNFTYT